MNTLARLDPGLAPLATAATTAAVVAVVALAAGALARLLKSRGAATRHEVDLVALLLVLASPAVAVAVGRSGLVLLALSEPPRPAPAEPPAPRVERPAPAPVAEPPPIIDEPAPVVRPAESIPASPREEPPAVGPPRDPWPSIRGGLLVAWAAGVLVLTIRLAVGLAATAALRRRARPVDAAALGPVLGEVREALGSRRLPPILEVDAGLAGPVAAGLVRPAVILPKGLADRLGPEGLRDVLVHEAAHAVRRDGLVGLLQRVAAIVYWPHPLVHALNRRLSRVREEACDDLVLGRGDPCRFARTLLELAERPGPRGRGAAIVGLFEARWTLEDRVARVLDPRRPTMTKANRWLTLPAAALLASAAVCAAAVRPEAPPPPQEPAKAEPRPAADASDYVLRGTVVDDKGAPAAGARVDLVVTEWGSPGVPSSKLGPETTGPDGGFAFRSDRIAEARFILVRATAGDGERVGFAGVVPLDPEQSGPPRIVLKPTRPLTVRVFDAGGEPVAGAAVEVAIGGSSLAGAWGVEPGSTDDRGVARFRVPTAEPIRGVVALKDGVGLDLFSNIDPKTREPATQAPPEVALTLRGGRTITLRALDSSGRPLAGVAFRFGGMQLRSRGNASLGADLRISEATTDAAGLARWRGFPDGGSGSVRSVPGGELAEDGSARISGLSEGDLTLNILLKRRARLSGRVVGVDGRPARGVTVAATGWSASGGLAMALARTGPDGSYTMLVKPDRAYWLAVTSPGLAAAPRADVAIGEGEHHAGLDFRLIEGTRLHGRAEFRPGDRRRVGAALLGPEYLWNPLEPSGRKDRLRLPITATLDDQGHYEAKLGPGDYEVYSPSHRERPTIHVDGTGEVALDLLADLGPAPPDLAGVLVEPQPGGGERPVKGYVYVRAADSAMFRATTDDAGRFKVRRPDGDVGLYAHGADLAAAVKVAKGTDEVKVVLAPSATASGRVVDAAGKPLSGEGPLMRLLGATGLPPLTSMFSLSKFDRDGRYEFKGLIPGIEYRVTFHPVRENGVRETFVLKTFRVEGPGPIDLGTFTVPEPKPAAEARGQAKAADEPRQSARVRVVDAAGKPVEGATVLVTRSGVEGQARTDAEGVARLVLPHGRRVSTVAALKDGVGLDYYENFRSWPTTRFEELPDELTLTLDGARTVTVRAADGDGRPVAGVRVEVQGVNRPGKLAGVGLSKSPATSATTDAEGVVRFAWLPGGDTAGLRVALDSDDLSAPDMLTAPPGGDVTLTVPVARKGRISGRVVHPDGSPARGVRVVAGGRGKVRRGGIGSATTDDDGRYTMKVAPDVSYAIAVTDPARAAEPRTGLVVREGQVRDGVDFRLIPGTRLRGHVAVDPAKRTGWNVVSIRLLGAEIPESMRTVPQRKDREQVSLPVLAGDDGTYEARLGPGEYEVSGPDGRRSLETIRVDGTGEVVRDFPAAPARVGLAGTVVDASGKPVAGASLRVLIVGEPFGGTVQTKSDAAGRFALRRWTLPSVVHVASPDDSLAALVPLAAEGDAEIRVTLAPSATVAGRIVYGDGKPWVGAGMNLFLVAGPGGAPMRTSIGGFARADRDGRYRFPATAVGSRYEVRVIVQSGPKAGENLVIKAFPIDGPGPVDLGDFAVSDAARP